MVGFPLAWQQDLLGSPREDGCPVRDDFIDRYLESGAYYDHKREPPLSFGPRELVLVKQVDQREFWIWTCADSDGAEWFVVASKGPDSPARWVLAQSNEDDLSAEEMLAEVLREMRAD